MKRRAVLATVSTSAAVALAGCSCPETEFNYDITLDGVSYDSTTGQWEGQCSLWANFSSVDGYHTIGIANAGIALYGPDGHRVGLVELGDTMWEDVSEPNRSEGGYCDDQDGTLSRSGEFEVSEFPAYFGLWYSNLQSPAYELHEGLKYSGTDSARESVAPAQWSFVDHPEGPFPPVPTQRPELGQYIEDARMDHYASECSDEYQQPNIVENEEDWDFSIEGVLRRIDTQYVPGLERAAMRDEEEILEVTVQMRPFRRPPDLQCESARTEYTVGVDLVDSPPAEIDVTHRDVDGNKLGSYRLETGGETGHGI